VARGVKMTQLLNGPDTLIQTEVQYDSGVYNKHDIVLVRGAGVKVWDSSGREYIDCIAGIGVASIGHSHPALVKAISEQAATLMICPQTFPNDKRAEFYDELASILPQGLNRIFPCNSGAEAIEAALKFSRVATGRTKFVAMKRGFAGRTMGALSLTFEHKYREPFAGLVHDTTWVAFNDLAQLEAAIDGETAAVFIEPVQGEGGVRPANPEFLRAARELTRKHGALLIFDEIQSGFCRTGKWWGHQHGCAEACVGGNTGGCIDCAIADSCAVQPDLMTMAKAIGGGIPLGAMAMTAAVADAMPKGGHGTTFGGNPLAMAAGTAAIRVMKEERLALRAAELGAYFMEQLSKIDSKKIKEVRGRGLMIGVELKEHSAPYLEALERDHAILAYSATPTVIRFLPPLVITIDEIDRVVAATAAVLEGVNPKSSAA
jgi:LysW-gamma-L-lysine/LysW-L-ornithine aminotransferase